VIGQFSFAGRTARPSFSCRREGKFLAREPKDVILLDRPGASLTRQQRKKADQRFDILRKELAMFLCPG
jgi:hypothetical protein